MSTKLDPNDADLMAELRESVLATDDRLDDVTRARLATQLSERLSSLTAPDVRSSRLWSPRRLVSLAVGSFTVAALAAAVVLVVVRSRPPSPLAPLGNGAAHPAPSSGGALAGPPTGAGTRAERLLSGSFDHIEVPAGTRVRARLGDKVRMTLIGPARIDVVSSTPELIEVDFPRGTLLADYDRRRGGVLRIRSPGVRADVIGTLFGIEAGPQGTRVSVGHGRVAVYRGRTARPLMVDAAQTLAPDAVDVAPLAPAIGGELEAHERNAEWEREGSAAPTSPPPPPPPPPLQPQPTSRPTPPSPPTPAGDARTLYRMAEAAMRRHEDGETRRLLQRVVKEFPRHPMADMARYELAQLALADGDGSAASAQLAAVAERARQPLLRQLAAFARCRVELDSGRESDGLRCLADFRTAHPRSPQDTEALSLLIEHAARQGSCETVQRLHAEFLNLHRTGRLGYEAQRQADRCSIDGP